MNEEAYIGLIYKGLKEALTSAEEQSLDSYTSASEANRLLREEIEEAWFLSSDSNLDLSTIDVEADLLLVKAKIESPVQQVSPTLSATKTANTTTTQTKVVAMRRRKLMSIAASFLLLAVAGYWFTQNSGPTAIEYAALDSTKMVTLPDGSKVTLNKNSQLRLPNAMADGQRQVQLTGEAFFDVKSDPAHPFEISAGNSTITVLGTSFNVKATDQECIVGVRSGKVKLSNNQNEVILTKGQVGIHLLLDDRVTKTELPEENWDFWSSKKVVFKNTKLHQALDQLMMMYGVNIEVSNDDLTSCAINMVTNQISIDKVLTKIATSLNADLKTIDSETFVIENGKCW